MYGYNALSSHLMLSSRPYVACILILLLAFYLLLQSPFALAQSRIEYSIGATSDNVWRGVSQSNNKPSVSGGLGISADNGLYVGTWVSTIDWDKGSNYKLDFLGGYAGGNRLFDYDIGLSYMSFPEPANSNADLAELYFKLGLRQFRAGVAYNVSDQAAGNSPYSAGELYTWVGYSIPVFNQLEFGITTGYYLFDEDTAIYGNQDYGHIQLDLSYDNFILSLSQASENAGQNDTLLYLTWKRQFSF